MKKLKSRLVPGHLLEPSYKNYRLVMDEFKKEAKANPDKNYLFIQAFATHGYNFGGTEACATPYYDAVNNMLELIDVEKDIRDCFMPNAFFWVLFVCCRELKVRQATFNLQKCLGIPEVQRGEDNQSKDMDENGDTIQNFIFTFGCKPGAGVLANTTFAQDTINLL